MCLSKIIIIDRKLITKGDRIILRDIVTWLNDHDASLSSGIENYIILKSGWQTRVESAWQVPKVFRNIPESFRRQVPRWRRRGGLGGAVAGGCLRPSGVWVRVRATLGTRSLGISLDFPPDNPPYLSTTHRSSNGGSGPSQWRRLSACLPACLLTCLPVTDSKTYGGCNADRDIVRVPDITRRALLYSRRID